MHEGSLRRPARWWARPRRRFACRRTVGIALGLFFALMVLTGTHAVAAPETGLETVVAQLSRLGDRSTGTPGAARAADYVASYLADLGIGDVDRTPFYLPVRRHVRSIMEIDGYLAPESITPLLANAISPGTAGAGGIEGPFYYAGRGRLHEYNGIPMVGAIIALEMDSNLNWQHAASLGAKAVVFIDRAEPSGFTPRAEFEDKLELSPIDFPLFHLPVQAARRLFGNLDTMPGKRLASKIKLFSDITWQNERAENISCLIPGTDPELRDQLLVVEAFYDTSRYLPGSAPGADEALSIASLLALATEFKQRPPGRSILLLATAGHAQTLAGMREFIWSLTTKSKEMKRREAFLQDTTGQIEAYVQALSVLDLAGDLRLTLQTAQRPETIIEALAETIKTEVDRLSAHLMESRMRAQPLSKAEIQELARERLALRQLGWRTHLNRLSDHDVDLIRMLVPQALDGYRKDLADLKNTQKALKKARKLRKRLDPFDLKVVVSLHLSSHGDGIGAFYQGWLYPLAPKINHVGAFSRLNQILMSAEQGSGDGPNPTSSVQLFETLRPSRLRPWQDYLPDRPQMGGEISTLAGYLGLTLATCNDQRSRWGTPYDTVDRIDWAFATRQQYLIQTLVWSLIEAPRHDTGKMPKNAFATVYGRAKRLRHGELFPDQPTPGTVVMAFQNMTRYYSMVNRLGDFYLKGVATKKHVPDKLIIEGYRFDSATGRAVWAIDKVQTGKDAYRLKIRRQSMETDLIMFNCRQSTLFNLLEPRNFRYMTKIDLLDGRREAEPLRYWYSRIDTRRSVITTLFLPPETRFKLTLSDSVLDRKLILTRATPNRPEGVGYAIDAWPRLYHTELAVARDMWALTIPRIDSLESHGIINVKLHDLKNAGTAALSRAQDALVRKAYDEFTQAATTAWALAARVYDQVEKTRKDVLFGVLFYIALFVPFAFCLERLLFGYTNIHKRLIAFSVLLCLLIAVIYAVHPAFELAYSPLVVILAFFIMGLSMIVTAIIFARFETEMQRLQRRYQQSKLAEIGRMKAFMAAFFLGISNLRRRRLRTALTCTTLIILTFTIMSFTSVKSVRQHTRLRFEDHGDYQGMLFQHPSFQTLPQQTLDIVQTAMGGPGTTLPRVWLEGEDPTRPRLVPVVNGVRAFDAQGLVGLSAGEPQITGIDRMLSAGRWFTPEESRAVILSQRMAAHLGVSPPATVSIMGDAYELVGVFDGDALERYKDLNGESITPVVFSSETVLAMTDAEVDALEAGEDIHRFQGRYKHVQADLIVIMPFREVLSMNGVLKGIVARPGFISEADAGVAALRDLAERLVDRFGLMLFVGEPDGVFVYHAADTLRYSGVPNIVIPLFIAILIVLNTMIGSVVERKNEIATYTSVGLAPSHVSFLFIAEAMAFAVLSVVLGYLVAQTSGELLSQTALWQGITVNYSSLAGVGAMLLVMGVVLVSVVYPAKVAGRIAIPDVRRAWTLPGASGNVIAVSLPFLMKYKERNGLAGFLHAYFQDHADVSHGVFSTANVSVVSACPFPAVAESPVRASRAVADAPLICLQIHADVWLAPFDFGIFQKIELWFCDAEDDPGFLEIRVKLVRQAGEGNLWHRINKSFLDELRKHLLVWRSMDPDVQAAYSSLMNRVLAKCDPPPDD